MLSKCLNPQCAAKFRYLWEGRLFRIDFSEVKRRRDAQQAKGEPAGDPIACLTPLLSTNGRERPAEHFWLCANCATSLTIAVSDVGEVQLVKLPATQQPVTPEPPRPKLVAAS